MQLHIGENILKFRRDRKIKQEDMAEFLGVTKASVSKWETKQSYPDILLLPQIAAYFGISIDELLGYEPQLSKEQIIKIYQDLSDDFASKPFEEVMARTKELVKKYYSCYPFLIQIAILWLNHFMLSQDRNKQLEILNDIATLCDHISSECDIVNIKQDCLSLKALVYLNTGKLNEVIELLQPLVDAKVYQMQPVSVLIQAYQMSGNIDRAELYNQIYLYNGLMELISDSINYLSLHMDDLAKSEMTISRVESLIKLYEVDHLNPNLTLQFYYQTAMIYSKNGQKEIAIEYLRKFVNGSITFLHGEIELHSDAYFTRVSEWFEESPLGIKAPRNKKVVYDSLYQALLNPAFQCLEDKNEFQYLLKILQRKEEF